DLLILGNPTTEYSQNEIYSILEFVKNGGNVLLFSDEGGDIANSTNLNDIVSHFGFQILPNIIFDPESHVDKVVWPIIRKFSSHPISSEITSIVSASGCSFNLLEKHQFASVLDVTLKPIAFASLTAKMKIYDFDTRQWNERGGRDAIVALSGTFVEGRFIALPSCSMLSSLNKRYGWTAKNNHIFIANVVRWLLEDRDAVYSAALFGDKVEVQLRIDKENFIWANSPEVIREWGDFSSTVNYAIKNLKKTVEKQKEKPKEDKEGNNDKESETEDENVQVFEEEE
ncbi:MAG: hypothetical protein GY870_15740, partial [archaeon]|nr:hypothetical protein [archaeon]